MKRTRPPGWTHLVLLLIGLALGSVVLVLARPFEWFAVEPRAELSATPASDVARSEGAVGAAAELEPGGAAAVPAPVPTSERRPVEAVARAGRASFRVVGPDGRPVALAQVLVLRDEQLLFDERTGVEGEVEFAADARPAALVIAVARRTLEWRDVVLEAGQQEIVLAEGGRVSGRFVCEDGAAPGTLRVALDSDHPLTSIPALSPTAAAALTVMTLNSGYVVLDTDPEGGLECTGLPGSWSGRLRLKGGWKVASTSHGDTLPGARGIRLAAPTADFVVRIARRRTLHGRVLLRDDGSPLAAAQLSTRLRSPDAKSPTVSSARTDEAGRFEVETGEGRVSSFELRLGQRFHESSPLLVLDAASLPADGDLGDVFVDDVRHVPFRLQDTRGDPVARGVAVAAGTRSAPTGRDGLGELRWLARSVERMAVEAPGFVPTEREIPASPVDPVVVTLEAANELVVTLRLPAGAAPALFKVVLHGEERITAVPVEDSTEQRRHVSEWTFPLVDFMRAPLDTYLCASPDARDSRATFRALRPGVQIELRVCGITGDMVYHSEPVAPLAAAERRRIDVPLESGMIVFRGRVLTEDGTPLVRASLQLTNQILGWTDEEGAFLCFLATPETGTLLVQHEACTTKYLHDYAVPTDGNPVEFRLMAARDVTVEVVDEGGAPVPQAEVWREYGGFTTNTHRIEGNRHLASSVPEEPFDIVVTLAGREYRREHDPSLPDARVVVPVHGRIAAAVAAAATAGRSGQFVLVLVPPAGEPAQPLTASRDSAPNLRIEISAVHPGTYQASLRYSPSHVELAEGLEESSSDPMPVVIEAGRETEVHLTFPALGAR